MRPTGAEIVEINVETPTHESLLHIWAFEGWKGLETAYVIFDTDLYKFQHERNNVPKVKNSKQVFRQRALARTLSAG